MKVKKQSRHWQLPLPTPAPTPTPTPTSTPTPTPTPNQVKEQSDHWKQRDQKIRYVLKHDDEENRPTTSDLDRNAVRYIATNH